jgi:hypothetical protein
MRPIGCPETSVQNYDSTLRNIPEKSADLKSLHALLKTYQSVTCNSLYQTGIKRENSMINEYTNHVSIIYLQVVQELKILLSANAQRD